jgi:ribokinase
MQNARKPIVVVGSINMDMVVSTPRIPHPGETLVGNGFRTTPGGKGANQAVAVARLGYPVQMIGLVGDDVFGQLLIDNLAASGVNTETISRVSGPSGVAPIFLAESGENAIVVVPGANGRVDPALIDRHADIIRSAGMVLCQLELPMETIEHTLFLCAQYVPVMLDPAPAAPLIDAIWSQIAWFTPNETEAAFYLNDQSEPEAATRGLLARGPKGVVLKRGAEGAYVASSEGEKRWISSFPVDAIDTVAAGDCFNGAFAVALLEGNDPFLAARFACAAAAISVTRRGAQASMPTRTEVDAFLAQQGSSSHCNASNTRSN